MFILNIAPPAAQSVAQIVLFHICIASHQTTWNVKQHLHSRHSGFSLRSSPYHKYKYIIQSSAGRYASKQTSNS